MPIAKVPIHVSYLLYLSLLSPVLARAYFATALGLCKLTGTPMSLLLHPLDFLGADDQGNRQRESKEMRYLFSLL